MWRISPLPKLVASQLRSSAILSDISQIVDELVCNSLDAHSTEVHIYVDIRACYIKVEDDGSGINRDDFALLGERHATSKLHSLEELEAGVQTLGFRGEGLSSISDTGLLEVTSRSRGSPHTYRKILKNCKTLSLGLAGQQRGPGTTVVVRDIFYNQPVRRKHLHSSSRKVLQLVKDHIVRLALIHPKVAFIFIDVERQEDLFHAKRADSLSSRICDIFGQETRESLQKIDFAKATFRLSGYISKQLHDLPRKDLQFLYINRQFVHRTPVHRLLGSVHKATTECSASPAFVLNLVCPRSEYDITLDASKTFAEFKDWDPVLSFVEEILKKIWTVQETEDGSTADTKIPAQALSRKRKWSRGSHHLDCMMGISSQLEAKNVNVCDGSGEKQVRVPKSKQRRSFSGPPFYKPRRRFDLHGRHWLMETSDKNVMTYVAKNADTKISKWRRNAVDQIRLRPNSFLEVERPILEVGCGTLSTSNISLVPKCISKEALLHVRALDQVDKKFIAAVAKGILLLIDQHAADERIRLEEFRCDVLAKGGHARSLEDYAEEIILTRGEQEMLLTYREKVEYWGWRSRQDLNHANYRSFSNTETCKVVLTAVPCIKGVQLTSADLVEYLRQLADTHGSSAPPPAVRKVLNFKACRGAIMFGDALLPGECQQLVNGLKKTDLCFQCAHGRPTMVPIVDLKALRHRCQGPFAATSIKINDEKVLISTSSPERWHGLQKELPTVQRAYARLQQAQCQ